MQCEPRASSSSRDARKTQIPRRSRTERRAERTRPAQRPVKINRRPHESFVQQQRQQLKSRLLTDGETRASIFSSRLDRT